MNGKGRIPISAAENISKKYKCPIVIIYGLEDSGDRFTVTTYGATKALCRWAAELGRKISQAILGRQIEPSLIEPKELPDRPMEWESKA